MRFRSLVVSWCVCAIHGSMQTALEYRSHPETSRRFQSPPLVGIETPHGSHLERSSRTIPDHGPLALSFPVSQPHSASRSPLGLLLKPGIKRSHRRSWKLTKRRTNDHEKLTDRFMKRGSRAKRRRKCDCRKRRNGRRKGLLPTKFKDQENIEKTDSAINPVISSAVDSPLISAKTIINISEKSSVNSTLETTVETSIMPHDLSNITFGVVSSIVDAMTTTEAITKIASDTTGKIYKQGLPREECKKMECVTKGCKKRKRGKTPVIDVLGQDFLQVMKHLGID